jgi:uncharacterized delta-60 repeat protein
MRYTIALVFFLFLINSHLSAQDGLQEKTFLTNSVVTAVCPSDEEILYSAVQSDGKLLVAGYYDNSGNLDVALVRYNTNGTLDNTFGTGGIVKTHIYDGPDYAKCVVVQPDGKIVITGYRSTELFVARYTAAGSLDATFGTGGITQIADATYSLCGFSIALQSDGKLVIGGTAIDRTTYNNSLALFRFTSTGVLDNTFGNSGFTIYGAGQADYTDVAMTIVSGDKILIASLISAPDGSSAQIAAARFTADGTALDESFGTSGVTLIADPAVAFGVIYSIKIAVQSHGEIIVGGYGYSATAGYPKTLIARLTPGGALDGTFGTGGLITGINQFGDDNCNLKIQPDDKIIVAGNGVNYYGIPCMVMYRFNAGGTIDNTFGESGIVTNAVSSINNKVNSIGLQADGKIILAGYSATFNESGTNDGKDFTISRFNGNGTPDYSYSANNLKTAFSSNGEDIAKCLIIQPDGKLVVAGSAPTSISGSTDFFVARFNSNGTPDNSFNDNGSSLGTGGYYTEDFGQCAALQADGKIVVAGYLVNGSHDDFEIMRFNADGTQDLLFNPEGLVSGLPGVTTTDFGHGFNEANGVAIQSDQKIVVAGYASNGTNKDFALARYTSDGTLDESFGTGGKVLTPIGTVEDIAKSVAIQPDGKILAAGYTNEGSVNKFAVLRYNTDGSLDPTFGTGGIVRTSIGSKNNDVANSIAIQADGKILLAGSSENSSNIDFALVRYSTNGTLDGSFGTGGIVTTPIGSGDDMANSIAIQADGKIIVAGSASNGTKTEFALARYSSVGALDNITFGSGGKASTNIGYKDDYIFGLALQSDGKIVAAGITNNGDNDDIAIVRYTGSSAIFPVELTDFNAKANNNSVELSWATATEVNNYGFDVERKIGGDEAGKPKGAWEKIGFVRGHGSSNSLNKYSYADNTPVAGKISYRLKQVDRDGAYKYCDAVAIDIAAPAQFKLMQNNPNPFNPSTAIRFQIPVNTRVVIKIYNLLGSEVVTLADEEKPAGSHIVSWNGRDHKGQMVSSGVYLYRLTAGNFTETHKMNLLK